MLLLLVTVSDVKKCLAKSTKVTERTKKGIKQIIIVDIEMSKIMMVV